MAITEFEPGSRTRIATWALFGVVGLGALVLAIVYLDQPPQMGNDDEAFRTVDALFTALGMRDESKVADCERRFHQYRESGRLPPSTARYLDRVIARARAGDWNEASKTLYDFMRAQRRESRAGTSDG